MAWLFTEVFLHGYSLVPLLTFRCWLIPCGSRGSVLGGMSTVDCRSIVPGSCKWGSSGSNLYSTKYLSLIILRVAQGFSDYLIQGCCQIPPNTWICDTFPFYNTVSYSEIILPVCLSCLLTLSLLLYRNLTPVLFSASANIDWKERPVKEGGSWQLHTPTWYFQLWGKPHV